MQIYVQVKAVGIVNGNENRPASTPAGKDGWFLVRHGAGHDIYKHPNIDGIITLPRHRVLSPAVARSIAKKAAWTD